MRVHDRLHFRTFAIDPDVKPHARIRQAAGERLEIFVDEHHATRRRFVEAVAELERPEGAGFVGPRRHLAGEARLVAFGRQNAASHGHSILLHFMRLGR